MNSEGEILREPTIRASHVLTPGGEARDAPDLASRARLDK